MNNTGIIRLLKEIKRSQSSKAVMPSKKPSFWSFLAILISLLSLYSQFFFINHDLRLNLVDSELENDTIKYQVIYHNRGNQDASILSSRIELFKKNRKNDYSIPLEQRKTPLILSNGRQYYEEMIISTNFENYNLETWNINYTDTLFIEIKVEFLNDYNFPSSKSFVCGWLKLDSTQNVKYYTTEMHSIQLNSDEYISKVYNIEK